MLERKCRMMLPLRFYKRIVGGLWGVERAEVKVFSVNPNAGLPFPGPKRARTHKARSTVASNFSLVPAVVLCRHIPQVGDAVIVGNAVDVVDIAARPNTMLVEPYQTMLAVGFSFDAYLPISLWLRHKTRTLSFWSKLVAVNFVGENPRIGVVVQKLFQQILRQCSVGFSHVSAPSKRCIGQGIDAGANCLFPRNIIEGMG